MFVPVWFTHAWSTGEGDLLGAYLHCTATTSFETVCKQFINGSVPFGYSLNSGFDTGYDSWFSSGAWQVGTPVQKMPAGTGALWVGESRGWTQRSCLPFPFGSGSLEKTNTEKEIKKRKTPFSLFKKLKRKARMFTIRDKGTPPSSPTSSSAPSHALVNMVPRSAWEGGAGQSWWCHAANSKVTTRTALNKLPASRKKKREDT